VENRRRRARQVRNPASRACVKLEGDGSLIARERKVHKRRNRKAKAARHLASVKIGTVAAGMRRGRVALVDLGILPAGKHHLQAQAPQEVCMNCWYLLFLPFSINIQSLPCSRRVSRIRGCGTFTHSGWPWHRSPPSRYDRVFVAQPVAVMSFWTI